MIIGAGLAGLSAAEAIAREHPDRFDITLLEAKRTVGGRAGSFTDPRSGEIVDRCQHIAMGCCTNLIGLLDRCGLGDSMRRYTDLEFHHPDHRPSRFAASKYLPPPLHLAGAIGSLRYLTARQKRDVRRALVRLIRTPGDKIRHWSARDWLRQQRQDDHTMRLFWDVVLISALGGSSESVSMLAARKVFIDGFAAARGASDLLVPKRPLSVLFGSCLAEKIESLGARIHTRSTVTGLIRERDNLLAVETAEGCRFDADQVISAVPWNAVGNLVEGVDTLSFDSFDRIPASPITGLHLWFDREITDRRHCVMVGTRAQWLFRQPCSSASPGSPCYYQVVISARGRCSEVSPDQLAEQPDQLVEQVVAELRHAFPAARKAKLVRSRIVTDPRSVFLWSPEVEAIRPAAGTLLPWFHLAGDWIATGWPATMEGAVISGRMAAASVLRSEGLDGVDLDPALPRGWLARWMIAP